MTAFSAGFRARNPLASVRLAELTTFRIGGPAELATIEERTDLGELRARPHRWLGRGANLLVGDGGVPGVVARLGQAFAGCAVLRRGGGRATLAVGGAHDLAKLVAFCAGAGLAGPEGLAGVPATVGGALRMNAGTATCWTLDWVSRVEVVLPGEDAPRWLERGELPASYRSSGLPAGTLFLACELELAEDDPERLKATATRLKQAKAASQPLALASAGCVFRNPSRELPAGRLIDELGLKGTRIGGAEISTLHGNFIVNPERTASAADVCALVRLIRARAWRERGAVLEMEVEAWECPAWLRAHPAELEGAAA